MLLLDDHLLRDVVIEERPIPFDAGEEDLATTNLWLFRLVRALASEMPGALSRGLSGDPQVLARLEAVIREEVATITIVPMRELVWSMAELGTRHRADGRPMSTAMVEALAAAHQLGGDLAVSSVDVGPTLQASAEADGIAYRVVDL